MSEGRQLNSIFKNTRTFKMAAADLSASTRSNWVPIPRGAKRLAIDFGWTATGTPVGVFSVEVTNNPGAASGFTLGAEGAAYTVTFGTQPAGTTAGMILDNLTTACDYIALVYTATSGGTGAVVTDSTHTAGTLPTLVIKD